MEGCVQCMKYLFVTNSKVSSLRRSLRENEQLIKDKEGLRIEEFEQLLSYFGLTLFASGEFQGRFLPLTEKITPE